MQSINIYDKHRSRFPDTLKHVPYKGNVINKWENLHIYKHKDNNQLISERMQTQNTTQY